MRTSDAQVFGEAFVERFGVGWLSRMDEVLPQLGVRIEEVRADSFEGALVRLQGYPLGTILVSRSIPERSRRLFTICHELGHYLLPGHDEEVSPCAKAKIEQWDRKLSVRELQANVFAAEILMPAVRVRAVATQEPSFARVEEISGLCGASLTASAYRLVEYSAYAVAVVWSEEGRVRWYRRAQDFGLNVRRGALDRSTLAAGCFSGTPVPNEFEPVPASAWIYEWQVEEGAMLLEHSKCMPNYGAVLTLLYAEDYRVAQRDLRDQDIEEDALDPLEFTLRRRRWPR